MDTDQRINIYNSIISITTAREEHKSWPIYDNTRLVAVNTCPRWAGVRYGHSKSMGSASTGRALALEAGAACHHAFAAVRLFQLHTTRPEHAKFHAKRLFPRAEAYEEILATIKADGLDEFQLMAELCGVALEYSQFYDDPNDKRRTLTNMIESLAKYCSRYDITQKLWVEDEDRPDKLVGIEIPFDTIITCQSRTNSAKPTSVRFVGRIDGISVQDNQTVLEENKTTSQINQSWIAQWSMAHQLTGYMLVASRLTHQPCNQAEVHGLALPQPRSSPYDGYVIEHTTRNATQFNQWLQWFFDSVTQFDSARDNWIDAPTYTHSCTRYFRECSLIPLCTADREEQQQIFDTEMHIDEWNPLTEDTGE